MKSLSRKFTFNDMCCVFNVLTIAVNSQNNTLARIYCSWCMGYDDDLDQTLSPTKEELAHRVKLVLIIFRFRISAPRIFAHLCTSYQMIAFYFIYEWKSSRYANSERWKSRLKNFVDLIKVNGRELELNRIRANEFDSSEMSYFSDHSKLHKYIYQASACDAIMYECEWNPSANFTRMQFKRCSI